MRGSVVGHLILKDWRLHRLQICLSIAGGIVCNSSYGLVWYMLARIPSLTAGWISFAPVWNSVALKILSAQIGLIAFVAAVTFFFQARKRDFI